MQKQHKTALRKRRCVFPAKRMARGVRPKGEHTRGIEEADDADPDGA